MKLWESPLSSVRSGAVLAGAVAALAFLNSLWNGFSYDDLHIIVENPTLHQWDTLPQAVLGPYWPGRYGPGLGLWRPLVTALYGLQWVMVGDNPVVFHVVNVLLHAGVTGLVVVVLGELLPAAAAFLAGLVFAVHPVHVEAVSSVVGVAEVLAALFFLLACLIVLRGGVKLGVGSTLFVLLCYGLAFLSKESAVTFPGVVLLLDSARRNLTLGDFGTYLRQRWTLYGGMVLVAGVILLARFLVLGSVARPFAPLGADLLDEIPRIWTVAATWPHIIRLFFFPLDLSVDYGPAVIPVELGWNVVNVVGAGLVLAILVLALLSWRGRPLSPAVTSTRALGFGVVWVVITLSPTSNLLFLSGILLAERTLYLPSVGFVAVVGWVLVRLRRERPLLTAGLLLVMLCGFSARSWTRTPTWASNLEVFTTLTSEHPEAGRSQWVLGDTYFQTGRVSEAMQAYRTAIGILGGHYNLLVEISRRLIGSEYYSAAELVLRYAMEDRPEFGVAPGLLATLYDRQGRFEEAEAMARASLREDSTRAVHLHLLSRALQAQGRLEGAIQAREAAIRHGEGGHWEQWSWLAEMQVGVGDSSSAILSMDSARARARSQHEHRQIDSLLVVLGIRGETGVAVPDSAKEWQNPTPPADNQRHP
ncbi:tetratricopeptide repeat protein [Gemmatimonadota bacterium]